MSTPAGPSIYVWDASPLNPLGRADRLDVLGQYVAGPPGTPWEHVTTEIVADELRKYSISLPSWLRVEPLATVTELSEFADWVRLLSDGVHNLGEASAAAWASVHTGAVIIDDSDAKAVITTNGLTAHGSLWLLCQSINARLVDPTSASRLIDVALAHGARFRFGAGGFLGWATSKGLLDLEGPSSRTRRPRGGGAGPEDAT